MNGEWLWRVARQAGSCFYNFTPNLFHNGANKKKSGPRIRDARVTRAMKKLSSKNARVEQRITLLPSFLSFFASFFSVKSGIPRFDHRLFLLRNYGMPNRCSARLFFSSKSFVAFIFISIFFFFFYFLDTSLID